MDKPKRFITIPVKPNSKKKFKLTPSIERTTTINLKYNITGILYSQYIYQIVKNIYHNYHNNNNLIKLLQLLIKSDIHDFFVNQIQCDYNNFLRSIINHNIRKKTICSITSNYRYDRKTESV